MIRVAICDDNIVFAEELRKILQLLYPYEMEITVFKSGFLLQCYIIEERCGDVDILFIDIEIGEENGIKIVEKIQSKYPHIQVTYISAYIKYASSIFTTQPAYFLIKPISTNDIKNATDKMLKNRSSFKKNIFVFQNQKKRVSCYMDEILFIESRRREIFIWLAGNRLETMYAKMNDIEEKLPDTFLRCHQSYIVNINKIEAFTAKEITLTSGYHIPISRPRTERVKIILIEYMRKFINTKE